MLRAIQHQSICPSTCSRERSKYIQLHFGALTLISAGQAFSPPNGARQNNWLAPPILCRRQPGHQGAVELGILGTFARRGPGSAGGGP